MGLFKDPFSSIDKGFSNIFKKPIQGIADLPVILGSGGQLSIADAFKKEKKKEDSLNLGPEEERIQQQLKERAQGAGDVAAQMQQGKAATIANLQRQQAAQGLKGGGTARMLADVERQQQGQIQSSLYGMKGKALGDEIAYLFGKKALQQKPPEQKSFLEDLIGF